MDDAGFVASLEAVVYDREVSKKNAALFRGLGLFSVVCIGINATVGSGVFALPDDMHREMGGWSPLAFALCAALLLPVALCMAELAGRTDETGGPYVYARAAFGNTVGFFVGWYCWIATFVAWAANTTLFVEVVQRKLLGDSGATPEALAAMTVQNKIASVAIILVLGLVNYVGVKPGAAVVNIVTVAKLVAVFCFVAVGLTAFDSSRLGGALPAGTAGIGQGIYLALFPLQGFEVAPVTAGETKNPKRNVPLGTMGTLVFSALLYVLVQAVLAASYPKLGDKTETPLQDAAMHLGPTIGLIVLIGSMVSIGGFTAGSALGSPRYAEAIAKDGLFPAWLGNIHERFRTPHIAILVTAVVTAILAVFFDYRRLVGIANITVVVQYVVSCLAVPALRKRQLAERLEDDNKFVVPGGRWLLPLIGAVGSAFLLVGVKAEEWLFAAVSAGLGWAILAWMKRGTKKPKPEVG